MRLVATFTDQEQAIAFSRLLLSKQIRSSLEAKLSDQGVPSLFTLWIEEEDEFEEALTLYEQFTRNFSAEPHQVTPSPQGLAKIAANRTGLDRAFLTRFILILCVLCYLFDAHQRSELLKKEAKYAQILGITPLESHLLYDYPQAFEEMRTFLEAHPQISDAEMKKISLAPFWGGLYNVFLGKGTLNVPCFEKIQQKELWRLISPVFLHSDFLHILFNMLWLILLGGQVESRVPRGRFLFLMLCIGVVSNTAQYLMTGPYFMGYSGIICGLVGFIWMRQRIAPWEGYPLQKGTTLFLTLFVVGLCALQGITLLLSKFSIASWQIPIANTAHVSGALAGIVMGKLSFFRGS